MGISPKVFISYAREDEPHAMRLYRNIEALGAEPWIDVTDMMVGVDWKYQIEKSLDECDYVVLLISNNYIDKTGYVQKEKRHIIDKFELMPLGSLFLIHQQGLKIASRVISKSGTCNVLICSRRGIKELKK
jgi:hypothetical protein